MMKYRMIGNVCLTLGLVAGLTSCEKEKMAPVHVQGSYSGIFHLHDAGYNYTRTGTVELHLGEETYTSSENPNLIPAGGTGSYFAEEDQLVFEAEGIWRNNFDWNLMLMGTYSYQQWGDSLKIWKEVGLRTYCYHLKR